MPADSSSSFAGYTLQDEIGPCPFGTAFRATQPATGAAVELRRLTAPPPGYLDRARTATALTHPNLARVLDAGEENGEPFVAVEAAEGADLRALIDDIGPMPATLAAEYTRQAASGLAAAHAGGLTHGDLRPELLVAGPLVQSSKPRPDGTPRMRPGPTAAVKVRELGLTPTGWNPDHDVLRLGEVLYFLLVGQPTSYAPLAVTRPDLPPELTALVADMLASDPATRPTMTDVRERLEAVVQAGKAAVAPAVSVNDSAEVPLAPTDAPPQGWAAHPAVGGGTGEVYTPPPAWQQEEGWSPADPSSSGTLTAVAPRQRATAEQTRRRLWLYVAAFVVINLLALGIWALLFLKP